MSGSVLRARCPAKINLCLKVTGRREDGYHELATVFQAIDVWDELEARPADTLSLHCDHPQLPAGGDNLVLTAADALRRRYGVGAGAAFRLSKRIPIRGGLGGGSSDAAAALLLGARLWRLEPSAAELAGLGGELGADVPFFLSGGTAKGSGRGDRIEPLRGRDALGEHPLLLGVPPFGLSTAEVFRGASPRLTLPANGVNLRIFSAHKWLEDNDFGCSGNDLEAFVFGRWPELAAFRDALSGRGARRALLSGSGSSVFGIFDEPAQRDAAADALGGKFAAWRLVRTKTIGGAVEVTQRGS